MRKRTIRLIGICILLAAVLAGSFVLFQKLEKKTEKPIAEAETSPHAAKAVKELEYSGETGKLRRHVTTCLIMGLDVFEPENKDEEIFYNYEQADFLALLVFDDDAKTCSILHINRDTMCNVPWLSVDGKIGGYNLEQLALSHTYGSGGSDSCENSCRAVSELLFGLPIDNYLSMTMDAIAALNDLVGGVTVTVEQDLTAVDPELYVGNTLALQGEQALCFVRSRMSVADGTNLSRMSRQRQFMNSFAASARKAVQSGRDLALEAYEATEDMICTDMTVNNLSDAVEKLTSYDIPEIYVPKGEADYSGTYVEYYIDRDDLWRIVNELYCE